MSPSQSSPSNSTPPATASSSSTSQKTKRKRVSRACDQCFLKKDRCDGLQPICTYCSTLSRTCTYDRPERKRGPTQGLRPRLEARIGALEAVLGFVLQEAADKVDVARLKRADEKEREKWRQNWWKSSIRAELEHSFGLSEDLVTAAGEVVKVEEVIKEDEEHSDVDLALPPTHQPRSTSSLHPTNLTTRSPSNPITTANASTHHSSTTTATNTAAAAAAAAAAADDSDEISDDDASTHFTALLSSGKGGSSLNRGLVPRGADPNAALGGFEIEFGGNQTDEDWVRSFVPPSHRGRRGNGSGAEEQR